MGVLRSIFLANQIAEFLKVQCHMNEINLFFCLRIDIKTCTGPIRFCCMISAPGTYLILKFWSAVLSGGQRLKEGDVYFKIKEIILMKFQNFVIFTFQVWVINRHYDI